MHLQGALEAVTTDERRGKAPAVSSATSCAHTWSLEVSTRETYDLRREWRHEQADEMAVDGEDDAGDDGEADDAQTRRPHHVVCGWPGARHLDAREEQSCQQPSQPS